MAHILLGDSAARKSQEVALSNDTVVSFYKNQLSQYWHSQ